MRGAIRIVGGLAAGLALTMAATAEDSAPLHTFYWSLPKSVLDVSVTYTLTDCRVSESGTRVLLTLSMAGTIAAKSIPDPDLGPAFPHRRIEVSSESLISFWKTASISRKVYASGILQNLSAKPQDQTGPIMGNFISAGVKLVSIGLGVPIMAGLTATGSGKTEIPQPDCGTARDILTKEIPALQKKLDPSKPAAEQSALTAQIQKLRDKLSITYKTTIDPAATGKVAFYSPTEKQVKAAGWYNDLALAAAFHGDMKPNWDTDIAVTCPDLYPQQGRRALPADTLFRDVPVCSVELTRRDAETPEAGIIAHQDVAFGQFGIAQRMPMRAGLFESFDWNFSFTEDGRITDAAFSTSAKGLGASTLVSSAVSAASSVDALAQKAAAADPETAALLAENAKIKAEVDNLTLKAQLEGLKAKTK